MGAPHAPLAWFACVNAIQDSTSWPHRELHRMLRLQGPHASAPSRTVLRVPTGTSRLQWQGPRSSTPPVNAWHNFVNRFSF
eukprot:6405389-Pyramimonas_sp.AAC.1